jgi:hypothetical protein
MTKETKFLLEIGSILTSDNSNNIKIIHIKYVYKIWLESLEKDKGA